MSLIAQEEAGARGHGVERERALRSLNAAKFVGALPLFEELAGANPSGGAIICGMGLATLATSNYWRKNYLTGMSWEDFFREFPSEQVYPHSARQEGDGAQRGYRFPDEGPAEDYVLLARADQGIARNYEASRQANRDKPHRRLVECGASGSDCRRLPKLCGGSLKRMAQLRYLSRHAT